jgi:hypothetical protein
MAKQRYIHTHFGTCRATLQISMPLWSSGQEFLATDPESLVRFPALPEKKVVGSGSGTESTLPREYY